MPRSTVRTALVTLMLAVTVLGCGKKEAADTNPGPASAGVPAGDPATSPPPGVQKADYSKGPGGEEIVRVVEGKERLTGFKDKKGKLVRHGPCSLHSGTADGPKLWEGDYEAGQRHGKLTGWYKNGTLWFERWFDKGKPVGTHKGYDAGKVVWELRFDAAGKPNVGEVDCFCVVCQLGFLYGTSTWIFSIPNGEDSTVYRFTNGIATGFTERDFVRLLGNPHEKRDVRPDRPGFPVHEQDWVYRCKDGTVTCRISTISSPLTMTQTKVSGRRKF